MGRLNGERCTLDTVDSEQVVNYCTPLPVDRWWMAVDINHIKPAADCTLADIAQHSRIPYASPDVDNGITNNNNDQKRYDQGKPIHKNIFPVIRTARCSDRKRSG